MGIYSNGTVFGIRMYTYAFDSEESCTLFERKYDEIMSDDQINEAYLFYTNLSDKTGAHFQIYTECTSTHEARIIENDREFMMWWPISLNIFLEKFKVTN